MLKTRQYRRGFTLIEVMIALTISAILLMIAVPSFRDASLGSKLRTTANRLISSTLVGRSEALKRNAVVTMCVTANGTSCTTGGWEQGWIIYYGTVPSASNRIDHQPAAPTGFLVSESGGAIILQFAPTGIGSTAATFTVCR